MKEFVGLLFLLFVDILGTRGSSSPVPSNIYYQPGGLPPGGNPLMQGFRVPQVAQRYVFPPPSSSMFQIVGHPPSTATPTETFDPIQDSFRPKNVSLYPQNRLEIIYDAEAFSEAIHEVPLIKTEGPPTLKDEDIDETENELFLDDYIPRDSILREVISELLQEKREKDKEIPENELFPTKFPPQMKHNLPLLKPLILMPERYSRNGGGVSPDKRPVIAAAISVSTTTPLPSAQVPIEDDPQPTESLGDFYGSKRTDVPDFTEEEGEKDDLFGNDLEGQEDSDYFLKRKLRKSASDSFIPNGVFDPRKPESRYWIQLDKECTIITLKYVPAQKRFQPTLSRSTEQKCQTITDRSTEF